MDLSKHLLQQQIYNMTITKINTVTDVLFFWVNVCKRINQY